MAVKSRKPACAGDFTEGGNGEGGRATRCGADARAFLARAAGAQQPGTGDGVEGQQPERRPVAQGGERLVAGLDRGIKQVIACRPP